MNRLGLADTAGRTFPAILARQAAENGDAPFLVSDTQSISFAEADTISSRLAGSMRALGVLSTRGGDRFRRSERVVARTPRGLEVGEATRPAAVLLGPAPKE